MLYLQLLLFRVLLLARSILLLSTAHPHRKSLTFPSFICHVPDFFGLNDRPIVFMNLSSVFDVAFQASYQAPLLIFKKGPHFALLCVLIHHFKQEFSA